MRRILHISDLHFGREDGRLVEALLSDARDLRPDLVAISGELTQRARRAEFARARRFLDRLEMPTVAVPGNHDIPLYDVWRRFRAPTTRFRRFVTNDLAPEYVDDEIGVVGINTARSNVVKGGRVSRQQIELVRHRLSLMDDSVLKILVAHHPFIPHPDDPGAPLVRHARELLEAAAACGLGVVLAGHLHVGFGDDARERYGEMARSVLVLQAGTATSNRLRGETNAYNVVTVDRPLLSVDVRAWDGERFISEFVVRYRRTADGWIRERARPEA